jgi:hypothetical protein
MASCLSSVNEKRVWSCSDEKFQFDDESFLVNRFEKTRSEAPVHLDGGSDDSLGQGFVFQGHPSSLLLYWIPYSRHKSGGRCQVQQGQLFISPVRHGLPS